MSQREEPDAPQGHDEPARVPSAGWPERPSHARDGVTSGNYGRITSSDEAHRVGAAPVTIG